MPVKTRQKPTSFTEVSIAEGIARRVRVYLVLKPVRPQGDSRLVSRLLGEQGLDRLVLEAPRGNAGKVHIPVNWDVGISFSMGGYLLQACFATGVAAGRGMAAWLEKQSRRP